MRRVSSLAYPARLWVLQSFSKHPHPGHRPWLGIRHRLRQPYHLHPATLRIGTLLCCFLFGCVSGTIVGTGKPHRHLYKSKITKKDVHRSFGKPIFSQTYDQPTPIIQTPEIQQLERMGKHVSVWGGNKNERAIEEKNLPKTIEIPVSSYDVFERKGPFADMIRGEAYGMISGLTLGVGDVIGIPFAIKERAALSKNKFHKTIWFDESNHFVAVFNGDIRKGEESPWGE